MVSQDTLVRSGLEVYRTQDVNVETTSDGDMSSEDTEKEGFVLHNGTVKEVYYVDEMTSNSFEHDYEDISSNGSVSLVTVDDARFYKGIKILLKKGYAPKKWDDLKNCLMGFITEQTYSEDGVELKVAGMTKLLEQEKQFTFTQTKRSEILKSIIESCGLKCKIDTTGLKDDIIDYTNVSSSGGDDNSGGFSGEVSADIAQAAKQICQGKTSCLEKAKAIWKWCHDEMSYEGYSNSQKGAEGCFKDRAGNCCDHANVVVQMLKAVNVKCAYEHSGSCYNGRGHVWAVAYCEGKWYRIDASVKSRDFDEVGEGCTGERMDAIDF